MKPRQNIRYILDKLQIFHQEFHLFHKYWLIEKESLTYHSLELIDLENELLKLQQKFDIFLFEKMECFQEEETRTNEGFLIDYIEQVLFVLHDQMSKLKSIIQSLRETSEIDFDKETSEIDFDKETSEIDLDKEKRKKKKPKKK